MSGGFNLYCSPVIIISGEHGRNDGRENLDSRQPPPTNNTVAPGANVSITAINCTTQNVFVGSAGDSQSIHAEGPVIRATDHPGSQIRNWLQQSISGLDDGRHQSMEMRRHQTPATMPASPASASSTEQIDCQKEELRQQNLDDSLYSEFEAKCSLGGPSKGH